LTEGEHILRFTVTGDWMDIDFIEFCEGSCDEQVGLAKTRLTSFESENSYNVFSATGKHLGRVDLNGASMSQALVNAGYARGTYMMRSVKGNQIYRVNVAK
jgi:alpha-galactosidase